MSGVLVSKNYWDDVYEQQDTRNFLPFPDTNKIFDIIQKHIPKSLKGLKVLEIGSGRCDNLYHFHRLGCKVYGIENSPNGFLLGSQFLKMNKINGTLIFGDVFDDKILKDYKESFDVVFSMGFIEHFENPREVIERHLLFLKRGGYLVVGVPNMTGVNYWLQRFFNEEVLKGVKVFGFEVFQNFFYIRGLRKFFVGRLGVFRFGLFYARSFVRLFLLRCGYFLDLLGVSRFFGCLLVLKSDFFFIGMKTRIGQVEGEKK